jgi:hypothetical protein
MCGGVGKVVGVCAVGVVELFSLNLMGWGKVMGAWVGGVGRGLVGE